MVRLHTARTHSDVAATTETPLPFPDDLFDPPPSTKRLSARDLARVVAQMNDADGAMDDVPTVEAPAPAIPAGIPSPLGDEDPSPSDDEVPESGAPDAVRARRTVLASWAISVAVTVVVTLLAMGAPSSTAEARAAAEGYSILRSSTSKVSVAFGGTAVPAPRAP